MNNSDTFITATEARNNFFDLLEKVKKGPYPINITVKGIPEVVLMSKDDYDSWMATCETLADSELMEDIREGDKNFAAGEYKTLEEVEKELGFSIADKGNKKYVSSSPRKQGRKTIKKT